MLERGLQPLVGHLAHPQEKLAGRNVKETLGRRVASDFAQKPRPDQKDFHDFLLPGVDSPENLPVHLVGVFLERFPRQEGRFQREVLRIGNLGFDLYRIGL